MQALTIEIEECSVWFSLTSYTELWRRLRKARSLSPRPFYYRIPSAALVRGIKICLRWGECFKNIHSVWKGNSIPELYDISCRIYMASCCVDSDDAANAVCSFHPNLLLTQKHFIIILLELEKNDNHVCDHIFLDRTLIHQHPLHGFCN